MIEYAALKVIWWVFVGVLLIGFAVMDGFDMGVGALLPFVARTDLERRVAINSIGPTWEGNQVWLVTAGGALFAAWPMVYAVAFSGFYAALILVLFALILRPVGFDYRAKIDDPRWRAVWDGALFIGGAVPALVFGVAFGNLLEGVPFSFTDDLRVIYTGGFFGLLNPFALLAGVVSLSMLAMHGGTFLQIRSTGNVLDRACRATVICALVYMAAFALAGIWIVFGIHGYQVHAMPDANQTLTPVMKHVTTGPGMWLFNYNRWPAFMLAPLLVFGAGIGVMVFTRRGSGLAAFCCSAGSIAGTILTAGFSMFPFVIPSSTNPDHSLTLWDSVSSQHTLDLMFWAVLILLPIVIAYTAWAYRVMRGKVTEDDIRRDTHSVY